MDAVGNAVKPIMCKRAAKYSLSKLNVPISWNVCNQKWIIIIPGIVSRITCTNKLLFNLF